MQRSGAQVADLLCLQENDLNQSRDTSVGGGGEIYEPLWDGQTSDPNQNGVLSVHNGSQQHQQQRQQQQDAPPPVPRRTVPGSGASSVRGRTHPLVTNQLPPTGMLPPSYSESEATSESLASPAYPAGRGQANNNNVVRRGTENRSSVSRSPNMGPGNVSPLDYSGSHFGGASGSHFGGASAAPPPLSPFDFGPGRCSFGAGDVPSSPAGALPAKMMEALGLSDGQDNDVVCGWNVPPLDDQGAPPPYMPRSASNRGPQVSLKERQVEALKKEMEHAGGVKVVLRKLDCYHNVAWVECYGGVW